LITKLILCPNTEGMYQEWKEEKLNFYSLRKQPWGNICANLLTTVFLKLDSYTGLTWAVDVMMTWALRIYFVYFYDQSEKVVFIYFIVVFSKRDRKHVDLGMFGGIRKNWVKHLPVSLWSQRIFFLLNFHSHFYTFTETQYMFSTSWMIHCQLC